MSDYGDEDNYEFEYSDQEEEMPQEDDITVTAENKYYNSKTLIQSNEYPEAMQGFYDILELEKQHSNLEDWGCKATKQIVKLAFRTQQYEIMLDYYKQLLDRINSGQVTRNKAEKSINSILDLVSNLSTDTTSTLSSSGVGNLHSSQHSTLSSSTSSHPGASSSSASSATSQADDILDRFYNTTLTALSTSGNERLAFKTKTRLARLYLQNNQWNSLKPLLNNLLNSLPANTLLSNPSSSGSTTLSMLQNTNSDDNKNNATQLLEIYSIQIQMYTSLRDTKRANEIYHKASLLEDKGVSLPSIWGIIRECGGKMYLRDRNWEKARTEFFDAVKFYEEGGNTNKTLSCLKYLLLASMLSDNRFNPFDDQSTKAYERNTQITAMTKLMEAYLSNDINNFIQILDDNSNDIRNDEFLRSYIDDLLLSIRTQVALKLTQPYTRVKLEHLGKQLGIVPNDTENLLVSLILDGKLDATIDQPSQILTMNNRTVGSTGTAATPVAMNKTGASNVAVSATATTSAARTSVAATGPHAKYVELALLASKLNTFIGTLSSVGNRGGGSGGMGIHMGME